MEQGRSMWKSIGIGAAAGVMSCVILCLAVAKLISGETIPMEAMSIAATAVLVFGVFLSGIIGVRLQRGKALIVSFASGGTVLLSAIAIRLAFCDAWAPAAVHGVLLSLAAALTAALLPSGGVRRKRH